jgi:hypothetical protein
MPDLNEFFKPNEIINNPDIETIIGSKPCAKCEKNADKAFWDSSSMTLSWECPDGHPNQFKVN